MVASKRKVRQRDCTSKKRFESEEEALEALTRWEGHRYRIDAPNAVGSMTPYACQFSAPYREHFHIGHDRARWRAEISAVRRSA